MILKISISFLNLNNKKDNKSMRANLIKINKS